jgi:hypothetical protein
VVTRQVQRRRRRTPEKGLFGGEKVGGGDAVQSPDRDDQRDGDQQEGLGELFLIDTLG